MARNMASVKSPSGCCWTCHWACVMMEEGVIAHTGCDNPEIPPEDFDECEANGWDIARPPCPFWEAKEKEE